MLTPVTIGIYYHIQLTFLRSVIINISVHNLLTSICASLKTILRSKSRPLCYSTQQFWKTRSSKP